MKQVLELTEGNGAYIPFNTNVGISNDKGGEHDPRLAEHWQILSPIRGYEYGTTDINRKIQARYRGGLLNKARRAWSSKEKPFGEQEIVGPTR